MGAFDERLAGSSKTALRESINKNYLTSLQLQTFLSEAEAVLSSIPLLYARDDLNDGIAITPSQFLSPNTKTVVLIIVDKLRMIRISNQINYHQSRSCETYVKGYKDCWRHFGRSGKVITY